MTTGTKTSPAKPHTPSLLARCTCTSISCAIFSVWFQFTFQPSYSSDSIHSYHTPLFLTCAYLVSLPLLKHVVQTYLAPRYDMRVLLKESMVLYNVSQVALNGWMVYRFIDAILYRGHPFIGDIHTTNTGTGFIIWVHYCDKYLEFFDTYFMVLRGRMDQVSFLHVYHHFSITWGWYAAIRLFPGGDSYFGALLNSLIHVLMYSYYALALLKIPCPWKRYLTQAQLIQFATVVIYSCFCLSMWPREETEWKHVACIVIQVWEMASLFALFFIFYRKSYGKNKPSVSSIAATGVTNDVKNATTSSSSKVIGRSTADDDQCQAAVEAGVTGATLVVGTTVEEVGKAGSMVAKAVATTKIPSMKDSQASKVVRRQTAL